LELEFSAAVALLLLLDDRGIVNEMIYLFIKEQKRNVSIGRGKPIEKQKKRLVKKVERRTGKAHLRQ
jgi:hypothetical protein